MNKFAKLIILIVLLFSVSGVLYVKIHDKSLTESKDKARETIKSVSKKTQDEYKNENIIDDENQKEKIESKDDNITEITETNEDNTSKTEQKENVTQFYSSSKSTEFVENNQNSIENNNQESPKSEERKCTPKKFINSWFVGEFTSRDSCLRAAEKYMFDYSATCPDLEDECGTRYWMLSLYDRNGNFVDYHTLN